MASRAQWEAEGLAKRLGWRGGAAGELERRIRERRAARLDSDFEAERRARDMERRASDRRAR